MTAQKTLDITEDEAELYDRQIRLWGLESQMKLRNANILFIGLTGLGAEVAKNIILAGVKSVYFLDSKLVTQDDMCAQFFVSQMENLGKNRATASVIRAQALNPRVKISADPTNFRSKDDEFFSKFDVVIATGHYLEDEQFINDICRRNNVKYFCGNVYGMFGYFFSDLLKHTFTTLGVGRVPHAQNTLDYVPLKEAVKKMKDHIVHTKLKKLDGSIIIYKVLQRFIADNHHAPDRNNREADLQKLIDVHKDVSVDLSIPSDKVPLPVFGELFGEISPSCAMIGGVLAQDVIRAVSNDGEPITNFFFLNPTSCIGLSMCIGMEAIQVATQVVTASL